MYKYAPFPFKLFRLEQKLTVFSVTIMLSIDNIASSQQKHVLTVISGRYINNSYPPLCGLNECIYQFTFHNEYIRCELAILGWYLHSEMLITVLQGVKY